VVARNRVQATEVIDVFDSVLHCGDVPASNFRAGAAIAGALHVVLFYGAWRQEQCANLPEKERPTLTFAVLAPPPPPPPLGGGPSRPEPEKIQKKPVRNDVIVSPRDKNEKPPEIEEPTEEPTGVPSGSADGVEGGQAGGVPGGVIDGTPGNPPTSAPPAPRAPPAPAPPDRSSPDRVLKFGEGMTRPTKISGGDPVYTREALVARVEGLIIVKCVITVSGALQNCQIIKGLPHMDQVTLAAISARRYTPVMLQGHPVAVDYVFTIRLVLPAE
jgi:protein TonB